MLYITLSSRFADVTLLINPLIFLFFLFETN